MIEKVFLTLSEDLIVKKKEDDEIAPEQGTRLVNQEPPVEEKKSGCC